MTRYYKFLASFFGLGFVPWGSGTLASLVIFLIMYFNPWTVLPAVYWTIVALIAAAAVVLVRPIIKKSENKDPSFVVVDEIIACLIIIYFLPKEMDIYAAAFLVFRFLDIFKIPPMNWLEKKFKNSVGWLLDDLMASVYAVVIIFTLYGLG